MSALLKSLSQPDLDDLLAGHTQPRNLLIELLHHLEGEIDISAPLVQPWATGCTDIQGIQHRRPFFKGLIELSAVHRAALFLDVSDGRTPP